MEYIEFGKIVNTHGIKGEVKIYPYTDDLQDALKLKSLYIGDDVSDSHSKKEKIIIKSIKIHKNMFLAMLENIDSVEKAEKLKNKYVFREFDKAEELEEDEYYVKDLIGLNVYLESGEEFGVIKDVTNTGANDIYTIASKSHGDVLIPAIKDVVKEIDIKGKRICIHLMEGLI